MNEIKGAETAGAITPGETEHAFFSAGTFQNRRLEIAVVNGRAIYEADIDLGPIETIDTSPVPFQEGVVITGAQYRWPSKTIPYTIDSALPDQQRVTDAIAHWQANTRIRLVPRTNQSDYVTFQPGGGCSSSVGRRGGQQFITLGPQCTKGNTIHEIGHTVGLWHEQSREDRDSHVTIVWSNIIAGMEHNFYQQIADGDDVGAYDFGSIMHYGKYAFAIDPNQPTIIAPQPIGQREKLSDGDIAAVVAIYP